MKIKKTMIQFEGIKQHIVEYKYEVLMSAYCSVKSRMTFSFFTQNFQLVQDIQGWIQ